MALCPGATRTEFADYQGFIAARYAMKPDDVVRGALKSIGKRTIYIAGWMNKLTVFTFRFIPRRLAAIIFGATVRDMVKH